MIKGLLSYSKSLKLFGTGFLISCFILLGSFVSAINGQVVPVDGFVASYMNTSYTMNVQSNGFFQSSYLGEGKQILMSDIGRYFFFLNDGTPYIGSSTISDGGWHEEGVPGNFLLCDTLSQSDTSPSNCTNYSYTVNSGYVSNVFRSVDKWYYGTFTEDSLGGWQGNLVCFSSSQVGKSLCFYSCNHSNCGRDTNADKIGGVYPIRNLSNSRSFGVNFSDIPNNDLGIFPGFGNGTNISGGNSTASNSYLSGNLTYSTCSNGYVLTQLDNLLGGQWRNTCFAGIFETGVELNSNTMLSLYYIAGQGVDFKSVFSLTNEGLNWSSWFNKYSSIYNQRFYNQSVYNSNPFYGKNALLFAYFKTLNDFGYNDSIYAYDLLNGCKLLLYSDWNSQYNGSYFSSICNNNVGQGGNSGGGTYTTGEVGSVDDNDEVLPPGYNQDNNGGSSSGGTAVGSSWAGVISGHDNETNYDGTTFINDYFQELKSKYLKPYNSATGGTLPVYIATFLCAIVLFRFLSH